MLHTRVFKLKKEAVSYQIEPEIVIFQATRLSSVLCRSTLAQPEHFPES